MRYFILLLSIVMYSCGPDEIPLEREETTKVDSSYYFRDMAELELEEQAVVETATACDYRKEEIGYISPDNLFSEERIIEAEPSHRTSNNEH